MANGNAVAGRDLWDRVAVSRPSEFVPRLPASERLLLDCYQQWVALQVSPDAPSVSQVALQVPPDAPSVLPAVTVAADSLVCPGRGLLSVTAHLEGKFFFSFCTWDMGSALGLQYVFL